MTLHSQSLPADPITDAMAAWWPRPRTPLSPVALHCPVCGRVTDSVFGEVDEYGPDGAMCFPCWEQR